VGRAVTARFASHPRALADKTRCFLGSECTSDHDPAPELAALSLLVLE